MSVGSLEGAAAAATRRGLKEMLGTFHPFQIAKSLGVDSVELSSKGKTLPTNADWLTRYLFNNPRIVRFLNRLSAFRARYLTRSKPAEAATLTTERTAITEGKAAVDESVHPLLRGPQLTALKDWDVLAGQPHALQCWVQNGVYTLGKSTEGRFTITYSWTGTATAHRPPVFRDLSPDEVSSLLSSSSSKEELFEHLGLSKLSTAATP